MRMQVFKNADERRCPADCRRRFIDILRRMEVSHDSIVPPTSIAMFRSSAAIGGASAFIGVSKDFRLP